MEMFELPRNIPIRITQVFGKETHPPVELEHGFRGDSNFSSTSPHSQREELEFVMFL
jgi:hypothetical protein